ncbi:MAG: glycosyltransferase family 2 protein [Flavobacteriaceae bacterium]|nr:glycosyltransferase family 2 protein [Flavobacteriaceae bacterium]
MFSVVIPLYNKEDYILETVNSVLNQTMPNFELIVVDDGSTDASVEVLNKNVNDDRLRMISIPNSGVSVARNTGIETARFNWIALLDADDWWDLSFLAEMEKAIKSFPNEFIFASGRSRVFEKQIERYNNPYLPSEGKMDVVNYFKVIQKYLPLINSSNVVIKKGIFEKYGYFKKGQKRHEDHDCWLRLCVENDIVFMNKNLSFYRKATQSSASQSQYTATDFALYLDTLIEVKNRLKGQNRIYFKRYYRRFSTLVYMQYSYKFTKEERQGIKNKLKKLLGKTSTSLLKIYDVFPMHKVYESMRN